MDTIDREILSLLQDDGRLSATALAQRVGLSLSACHRRVKDLERTGAIDHYRAVVSPASVGLEFEAMVFVTMRTTDPDVIAAFEAAAAAEAHVVSAERLFGEPDYILRVLARDLADYQRLYDTRLGQLPGVHRLTSTLVMKRVGPRDAVPVRQAAQSAS